MGVARQRWCREALLFLCQKAALIPVRLRCWRSSARLPACKGWLLLDEWDDTSSTPEGWAEGCCWRCVALCRLHSVTHQDDTADMHTQQQRKGGATFSILSDLKDGNNSRSHEASVTNTITTVVQLSSGLTCWLRWFSSRLPRVWPVPHTSGVLLQSLGTPALLVFL